jgi:hypothetical protein
MPRAKNSNEVVQSSFLAPRRPADYAKVSLAPGLILGVGLLLSLVSPRMLNGGEQRLHAPPSTRFRRMNARKERMTLSTPFRPRRSTRSAWQRTRATRRVRSVAEPVRQAITHADPARATAVAAVAYTEKAAVTAITPPSIERKSRLPGGAILRHLLDEHPNVVFATTEREVGSEPVKKPCHDHVFRACRSMPAA